MPGAQGVERLFRHDGIDLFAHVEDNRLVVDRFIRMQLIEKPQLPLGKREWQRLLARHDLDRRGLVAPVYLRRTLDPLCLFGYGG